MISNPWVRTFKGSEDDYEQLLEEEKNEEEDTFLLGFFFQNNFTSPDLYNGFKLNSLRKGKCLVEHAT